MSKYVALRELFLNDKHIVPGQIVNLPSARGKFLVDTGALVPVGIDEELPMKKKRKGTYKGRNTKPQKPGEQISSDKGEKPDGDETDTEEPAELDEYKPAE